MSKESFIRGFCKAAEDHGVDPVALAKYAQVGPAGIGPLRGNEARSAVQALFDKGYITEQHTPMTTRLKEWFLSKLPGTAHWQYKPNNPGYITVLDEPGSTRAVSVPSRQRTAQVLEKNTGGMRLDDWRVLDDVKAHRPISAADHSQMQNAIERANPEAASRHGWNTIGKSAPHEYRGAAQGLTETLSEGVASGKMKIPPAAKVAPAAAKAAPAAAKAAPATARAARLSRIARLFRR